MKVGYCNSCQRDVLSDELPTLGGGVAFWDFTPEQPTVERVVFCPFCGNGIELSEEAKRVLFEA